VDQSRYGGATAALLMASICCVVVGFGFEDWRAPVLCVALPSAVALALGVAGTWPLWQAMYCGTVGALGPVLAAKWNDGTSAEEDPFIYGAAIFLVLVLGAAALLGHVLHEVAYLWRTRPSLRSNSDD
jgi:hypothetical protein